MDQAEGRRARGIDRALDLLDCLHHAQGPLRIGEIARRLAAPRSTIYELTDRLTRAGLLSAYPDNSVFFGRTMHFYGTDYLLANAGSRRAWDAVRRLAETTRQAAQFCVLAGDKYVVEHMQSGNAMFRISADIGRPIPIPWTASGRLLLGHMGLADIEAFVPPEDFVLPDGRRIEPATFHAEVRAATAAGFCVTTNLVDDFTRCMAAPVRRHGGDVAGCLCLVLPAGSPDQARLLATLREVAAGLGDDESETPPRPTGAAWGKAHDEHPAGSVARQPISG